MGVCGAISSAGLAARPTLALVLAFALLCEIPQRGTTGFGNM